MSVEPSLHWRFDRPVGWLDPRASMVRATTGYRMAGNGYLSLAPANTLRPHFDPQTGRCLGALIERQATNLLAPSSNFSLLWTKYNCTETLSATTAPDGTVSASKLSVTNSPAWTTNSISITAGRGIAFSVFVKADKSAWAALSLTDGVETLTKWFNLYDGSVGSTAAGAGATIALDQAYTEVYPNGWRRIVLCVTTASSTAWTCGLWPASDDGLNAANRDSMYAWGMQAEADINRPVATSYIVTAMVSATRNADNISIQTDTRWYNASEGTILFEYIHPIFPFLHSGAPSLMLGGIGDTFTNTIYVGRGSTGTTGKLYATLNSASGGNTLSFVAPTSIEPAAGTVLRCAVAWGTNDTAFAYLGNVTSSTPTFALAGSPPRLAVGFAPFGSSAGMSVANTCIRQFSYFPRRLSNSILQTLTS